MNWAYSPAYTAIKGYEEIDGKVWILERSYPNGFREPETKLVRVEDNFQPTIIDNVPLEGFTVARSVSRSSTSNKVWRINDPRGFQLEMSTGNFEDLLMSTTIHNGEIMAPCIWQTGKNLVVA